MTDTPKRECVVTDTNPTQVINVLRRIADFLEKGQLEIISGGILVSPASRRTIYIDSDIVLSRKE